jgi:hypothetical protein
MNNQLILLPIILMFIFSCSEDDAIIISNSPTNLPSQNYKINLQSNSGLFIETVTIYWNGTDGDVELTASDIPIPSSGNSHTFSEMTPGEFRDIIIQVDSIYLDSIQIFTRPVYPVSNFRYEVEMVMRANGVRDADENYIDLGNGVWDADEDFTDANADGVWNEGETYTDLGNGQWDVGEEFDDTENQKKYHRVLNWSPTMEPDSTFSNYTIYRSDNDNVDILINPENCGCDIAYLSIKLDSSFTDSMVTEESGEYTYFYQIRVNSGSYGRNSYIYNYTDFTPPSNISLVDANVSKNNSDFIQVTWDAVSTSTYLYQYEIWRISDDNADDLRRMAIIVDPDQEKFMDRNVGNGTSYNYAVTVVTVGDFDENRVFSDYVTGWSIP